MEKDFQFSKNNVNVNQLQPGIIHYDYNLFYEKKRMSPFEKKVQSIIFLGVVALMTLGLGYDTYNMYQENKDRVIIPSTIEEGVIKLMPMNIEINRTRKV